MNKSIYEFKKIRYTIQAFGGICEVDIKEDSVYWICIFSKCGFDLERTIREFENYLISISN